ncbi:MAG TPA: hypothetical protein PKC28_16675 [Bdellovibrionales bacterium]|nr:hypothetical protein [Bdellovibrionales bacterium]
MFSRFFFFISVFALTACSAYQSEGRKFLEKRAFEYAEENRDSAMAHWQGCDSRTLNENWTLLSETPQARVFSDENEEFSMRVQALGAPEGFSCAYRFSSAQDMIEHVDAAVILTLGLGEFAFRPLRPIK